jgi:hypothetical protein
VQPKHSLSAYLYSSLLPNVHCTKKNKTVCVLPREFCSISSPDLIDSSEHKITTNEFSFKNSKAHALAYIPSGVAWDAMRAPARFQLTHPFTNPPTFPTTHTHTHVSSVQLCIQLPPERSTNQRTFCPPMCLSVRPFGYSPTYLLIGDMSPPGRWKTSSVV